MKITALDLPQNAEDPLLPIKEELPEGPEIIDVMQGLKVWRNPVNRFFICRLHCSADPNKRSKEWREKTKAGMDAATFAREYDLVWEALEGKPVYVENWSSEFHISRTSLGWNPRYTVCRGWDFGLYPACVFAQLFPYSRLIILREAVGIDIDTERFIYEVHRLSNEWFPGGRFIEFIDPTGKNRAGTDGRAYTQLLAKAPLRARRIIPGENSPVKRRGTVIDFLKENVKGLPCLLVDPSCEYLIKGFNGGYLFAYNQGTLKPKPEKNIFSHIHDALQYLCSKIRLVDLKIRDQEIRPSEPRFGQGKAPPPHVEMTPHVEMNHSPPINPYRTEMGKGKESTWDVLGR
jgi:hypothetical protein